MGFVHQQTGIYYYSGSSHIYYINVSDLVLNLNSFPIHMFAMDSYIRGSERGEERRGGREGEERGRRERRRGKREKKRDGRKK